MWFDKNKAGPAKPKKSRKAEKLKRAVNSVFSGNGDVFLFNNFDFIPLNWESDSDDLWVKIDSF